MGERDPKVFGTGPDLESHHLEDEAGGQGQGYHGCRHNHREHRGGEVQVRCVVEAFGAARTSVRRAENEWSGQQPELS